MEPMRFAPLEYAGGEWDVAVGDAREAPCDLRVLTWNVWFGGHMFEERRDALFAELARRRPDVVALQEVTPELLDSLLEQPWLQSGWQISSTALLAYDVMILSRRRIRRMMRIELPSGMGRNLLVAELACGFTVATVHLESTREEVAARVQQLGIIQPALLDRSTGARDALLLGDMNFDAGAPRETAALDQRFVDVWPALHEAPGYTIDSSVNKMLRQVRDKSDHRRLDRMFLASARWRATSIELVGTQPIAIDGTFVSDHFGLEATFAIASGDASNAEAKT